MQIHQWKIVSGCLYFWYESRVFKAAFPHSAHDRLLNIWSNSHRLKSLYRTEDIAFIQSIKIYLIEHFQRENQYK